MLNLIILFGVVLAAECSEYHGYEEPDWTLLPNEQPADGSYQVRRYSAAKWVTTNVTDFDFDDAGKTAFWRLFAYIQGNNNAGQKIKMTVPVTSVYRNRPCVMCNRTYTMSFYIPKRFQASPPTPSNSLVVIENRPEIDVYVRTFGGFAKSKQWQMEASKLYASMTQHRVKSADRSLFYAVGYDSPWRFFFRRNEVWMLSTVHL